MSKNAIIGVIVAIIVIGGGIWLFNNNAGSNYSLTSTSTPTTNDTNPTPGTSLTVGAPAAQTSTTVVPSASTAVVTGSVIPNGALTSYWFEYGLTADLGKRVSSQLVGSGFTSINSPAYISGLTSNTLYYFRLDAQNSYGVSQGVIYNFRTNSIPATPALAPTASTNGATVIARTSADVNGVANPKGSAGTYWFEYGTTNNFGSVTTFQSAGEGTIGLPVSASLLNLQPLTTYFFRLNVQNQFGTINGSTLTFKTTGPALPGLPTADTTNATSVTASTATFHGQINPNGVDTNYWFEYSTTPLSDSNTGTSTPSATLSSATSVTGVTSLITGLSGKTKYYYRVVAKNQFGTINGDSVSFTTK